MKALEGTAPHVQLQKDKGFAAMLSYAKPSYIRDHHCLDNFYIEIILIYIIYIIYYIYIYYIYIFTVPRNLHEITPLSRPLGTWKMRWPAGPGSPSQPLTVPLGLLRRLTYLREISYLREICSKRFDFFWKMWIVKLSCDLIHLSRLESMTIIKAQFMHKQHESTPIASPIGSPFNSPFGSQRGFMICLKQCSRAKAPLRPCLHGE